MLRKKKILDIVMFALAVFLVVTAIFHEHMGHATFAHIHTAAGILFVILLGYHLKFNWKAVLMHLGIRRRRAAA